MNRAKAAFVVAATILAATSAARSDVPYGKNPGNLRAAATTQVQCQVNDAICHRVAAYVIEHIGAWAADPTVISAIKAQNVTNAKLTNLTIDKLDIGWIERSDKTLIDSKMNNDLSTFLRLKKQAGLGVVFEIFVFDQLGLNVGQTDMTQDYNQGDEAKYWKSFMVGPGAMFVDQVGKDGGRDISQASLTITDPVTGKPIGAMTVGIDVDQLSKQQ